MNEKKIVKKPLPCLQNWNEMIPMDNGRLCMSCGKSVLDFRKKSWAEIERAHKTNPVRPCGVYSDEQLEFWGQEIPSRKFRLPKLSSISATVLAMFQLLFTALHAQTTNTTKSNSSINNADGKHKAKSKSNSKIVSGNVKKENWGKLYNAKVEIKKGKVIYFTTHTDSAGHFSIDIISDFSTLPDSIEVSASSPGLISASRKISKSNLQPIEIVLQYEALVVLDRPSAYYAYVPDTSKDKVYDLVAIQEQPKFPGGDGELSSFMKKNINYPQHEKENGIQGKVFVTFIVDKDGSVTDAAIYKGIKDGSGCDAEALRVVKLMPKWTPGKQNGKNVKVRYILPVFFKL